MIAKTFAKHIKELGFNDTHIKTEGALIDFVLTKSEGLSPALQKTEKLLSNLNPIHTHQLSIFEHAY